MPQEVAFRNNAVLPATPLTITDTGLSSFQLSELTAKTMYYRARATEGELGDRMHLARTVIDEIMEMMKREGLVETMSKASLVQYEYALTERGRARALQAFEHDRYVGPAPVPYSQYLAVEQTQAVRDIQVVASDVRAALTSLVLSEDVVAAVGAGVVSAQSLLIWGESGNGKSTIAAAVREMLGPTPVAIPYALEVGGHIVKVFDGRLHEPLDSEIDPERASGTIRQSDRIGDRRFVLCRRPLITLGSELSLEDLDLKFSLSEGTHAAPPQVKANGGVLVIDDLGRQHVRPEELLNRWMAPMATGIDQLALRSGELVRLPFDVLLVFATNLSPQEIGDEAFLRRIRHKVTATDPSQEQYLEIFRRSAVALGFVFESEVVYEIIRRHYTAPRRQLRASHPGDILRNVLDFARFDQQTPVFTLQALDRAARAYFA